ncbi:GGDEF domain-containing protein [Ramlibacter tataouinensis]|uniref:Regulator protein, GGDEF domain-like protein n=1 Tax=Ramlibacter tataouinensis (strain ATCC BAA-407 / DSM 14655 / LMG 21543 / TTB310) TaxID=365046 RepID=F5XX22_RAMTT|nr:GGDEF domain-containing protein [Ramlibacter tataouinensis]AEG92966.1 regulator protein, GGDEF domain-like protein [Ramlibacter tataouinensis TTB310]
MMQDFAPTSVQDPLGRWTGTPPQTAAGRSPWVLRLARWLRASSARRDEVKAAHVDPCTGLLNRAGLLTLGDRLLGDCRRRGRPFAVAVFDCHDLLEVNELYGRRVSHQLMERLAARMDRLAGVRGLAARTGPAQFAVALPGLDREGALQAIRRVLGESPCIELEQRGDEIVLVPDFMVDIAGSEAGTAERLYRKLCAELARMQEFQQRRCSYMRRQRERHSRPMDISSAANDTEFGSSRPAADTIPMVAAR